MAEYSMEHRTGTVKGVRNGNETLQREILQETYYSVHTSRLNLTQ